jgi:poly [ADP-ribose] polymerase 2/3/4
MSEIKDKEGKKVARLICVTGENNNKFYNMTQLNESEFLAEWGRVEGSVETKKYPMSKWDSTYKSKTKPSKKPMPYTDVTHLHAEVTSSKGGNSMFHSERPKDVVKFVENLMRMAKESVERNYVISSQNVTKAQVDEAQDLLNKISVLLTKGQDSKEINDLLLELYKVIPRKMKKVQEHLIQSVEIKTDSDLKTAKDIFSAEQDALDAMSGQVAMNVKSSEDLDEEEFDALESANLEAYECSPAEIEMIKSKMGPNAKQFVRAIRVRNRSTEERFNRFVASADNKKTDLLWHGSRNENWWSIFQQGLKIRPSNAVLTGSMFGYGVYFADKAQKSIGYTSLSGSYWAGGSAKTAVLALYEIHQGKQLEILNWKSEHSRLDESSMKRRGCDSVFAKGGADLRNNEYITYNTDQSTIRYLVEITK